MKTYHWSLVYMRNLSGELFDCWTHCPETLVIRISSYNTSFTIKKDVYNIHLKLFLKIHQLLFYNYICRSVLFYIHISFMFYRFLVRIHKCSCFYYCILCTNLRIDIIFLHDFQLPFLVLLGEKYYKLPLVKLEITQVLSL